VKSIALTLVGRIKRALLKRSIKSELVDEVDLRESTLQIILLDIDPEVTLDCKGNGITRLTASV
jgi:hypothetical protein